MKKLVLLATVVVFAGTGLTQETLNGSETATTKTTVAASEGNDEFYSEDGDSPFGVMGECHVDSRVGSCIRVYVNGQYRGTLAPYGDIFPFVGDSPNGVTCLYAVTVDGRLSWSRTLYGSYSSFQWILLYP
jgi:hypothetical protein